MMDLAHVINHARNREYMSGIDREKTRIKETAEVFTPTWLVQEMLEKIPDNMFLIPDKTFLDPSCGDGQFLSEVLIRKVENGISFEQALNTIYGVDLMQDNVDLCRNRLLCGYESEPCKMDTNIERGFKTMRDIVENNIVCADGLKYHYRFDGTPEDRGGLDATLFEW